MNSRQTRAWLTGATAILCLCPPTLAWHEEGHDLAARQAIGALEPNSLAAFFREGADTIAHASLDPDCFTRPIAPAELHAAESPEHRFNLEVLEGNAPPARRYEYVALCAARRLDPSRAGFLPYAVAEWTQRLTVAFAEHRRWPENPLIRQKCLLYAGILSHYAADLCQPLHTTIHYDGRAGADGNSPRSGIHLKMDSLLGKLAAGPSRPLPELKIAPLDDLMVSIWTELATSHALVGRVYELEKDLPAYEAALDANSPASRFAEDRLRACARFTASLYLTAWRDSQNVRFPEWHKREASRPARAQGDTVRKSETPDPKSEGSPKPE